MQDIIKMYMKSGKVGLINPITLAAYRYSPHKLREWAVYCLYGVRKSKVPKNKFMIYAQGRTGSTVLVDLMNSHPDVFTFPEILQGGVVSNVSKPLWWAEGICSLSKKPTTGFKVKVYQIEKNQGHDPKKVLREFHERGWKIIYLKRANILRHAVSDLRSEKTGHFHNIKESQVGAGQVKQADGKKPRKKVHITWEELKIAMDYRVECLEKEAVSLEGIPHHTVEYERDLLDQDKQPETLNGVYEFLGVPSHTASTEFKKVTAKDIADDVENFSELEPLLSDSKYASYLGWG